MILFSKTILFLMKTVLLVILISITISFQEVKAQPSQLDSLNNVLKSNTLSDSLRLHTQLLIAENFRYSNPDTALMLTKLVLEKSQDYPYITGSAKRLLGNVCLGKSQLVEAIKHLKEGLQIAEQLKDDELIATIQHTLGTVYTEKGEYNIAIDMFFMAIKTYDKIGNRRRIATLNNDIAIIYFEQELYAKAITIHKSNLVLGKELKDDFLSLLANANLGLIFFAQESYDSAIYYYRNALKINETVKHNQGNSLILCNMAEAYLEKQEYQEGIKHAQRSLKLAIEFDYKRVVSRANSVLGALYLKVGKEKEGLICLEKGYKVAQELKNNQEGGLALSYLHEAYAVNKKFEKAYEAYKSFTAVNDSLNKVSDVKKVFQKESEFKEEKFRLEQEKKELAYQAELEKQVLIRNGFFVGFILLSALAVVVYRSYQSKKKASILIAEKNNKLSQANEELTQQHEELLVLNENLEHQKQIIESTYAELRITSGELAKSIEYASDIQEVIMPSIKTLESFFGDLFIIFKPKDIVSGDFYWFSQLDEDTAVFVLSDCTGHGVPGAFMSLLGSTLLHETINVKGVRDDPARVLRNLHSGLRNLLKQEKSSNTDGMDISICFFTRNTLSNTITLTFAGAKSKMYYVSDNQLSELRGDRMYVGGRKLNGEFSNHILELPLNTKFYLFTDGFIDQNNKFGKKIGSTRFKQLIENSCHLSFSEQQEIYEGKLQAYQGETKQRDDISLIGLSFK